MDDYAIIRGAGKLFAVHTGDVIKVDGDLTKTKNLDDFFEVLVYDNGKTVMVGQPVIKNAKIKSNILKSIKDKKILVSKFKSKVRYRVNKGHRQVVSQVKIDKISLSK